MGGRFLVKDRKISFFAATKKYLNQAHVPYGHLLPCDISEGETNEIKSLLKRVIKGLELDNGPLNFDIMITDRGPVIIELGGRLGGNCLPQLMHYHTGNDYYQTSNRNCHRKFSKRGAKQSQRTSGCLYYGKPAFGISESGETV